MRVGAAGTQSCARSSRPAVRVAALPVTRVRPRPAAATRANAAPESGQGDDDAKRRRRPLTTRVFLGWMLLRGTEPVVNALPAPLRRLLMLHSFVLVEERQGDQGDVLSPSSPPPPPQQRLLLLDFLPVRPTHLATAATLLTGGSVPGVARARELPRGARPEAVSPVLRLVWEGEGDEEDEEEEQQDNSGALARASAAGAAVAETPLRFVENDCRTHSAAVLTAVLGRTVSRGEVERWIR